ncbi:MAG: sortase domain-containing protein [Gaiellaceae bacterium]
MRAGRDTCGTTGVGFYRSSPYGVRWYGDYRVQGRTHLFCIDLRYWYASRTYRYKKTAAATLRNRDGARVPAANRHRMAYALWRFGRSGRASQQAAVMVYVHSLMGDARPGELDATPRVARIARTAARYAGPYRIDAQLPSTLVVGTATTATIRVRAASGAALPDVPLTLTADGASGVPATARTDAHGVARVPLVPAAASGLAVHVRTASLAATEPIVLAPTAGASRANGQRLAAAASQRVSGTLQRRDVTAVPQLTAVATPTSTTVGSTTTDTVTVSRTGGASTSVQVELWGPFPTPTDVACTGSPMWSGSFVAAGDTTTGTAPVPLQQAGYYGYVASIPAGAATACGASSQTVLALARPALATTASASVVRRGGTVFDRLVVHGLGRTPATVAAALYGPFGTRAAIRCDASHLVWQGTVTAAGDGEVQTAPVRLARAGFYGFREQIAASSLVAGAATACAPAEETALVAPEIVTGRGDVADFAAARGGGALRPTRIRIAARGIDAPVSASGIDVAHGVLGIPSDIHRVGWWRDGAAPGDAAGAVLVAGHVDSAAGGVGAFFPLRDARAGDAVELETASGRTFAYRVLSVRRYAKAALPPSVYASGGKPRLVLVTCGGPFDAAAGHYRDDLVVVAAPAN